ncbi:MAG: c-type cytochrome domain-containing protein [Pirellulaceae bacterium]|nr:c-type cytochrome [Planctomycetales bacterium]
MRRNNASVVRFGIVVVTFFTCQTTYSVRAEDPIVFSRDVAGILQDNCVACHGPKKAEGGYRVDTFSDLMTPGDSAAEPIVANKLDESELYRRITTMDTAERMPADTEPLDTQEIERIKQWIESGGVFDGTDPKQSLAFVRPPKTYPAAPGSYAQSIPITAVAFSRDGTKLYTGGYHELLVWDIQLQQLTDRIGNLGERIFAIALSDDGKSIAVGCGEAGRNGEVRLIDLATKSVTSVVARASDVVLDVAFRPSAGNTLAAASADGIIRVVNVRDHSQDRTIASHADAVNAVAWSDDGKRLLSASRDKSAKVFDAETGDLLTSYQEHGTAVRGVAFLADGKHAISVGADAKLRQWEVESGKKTAEIALPGEAFRIDRVTDTAWIPTTAHKIIRVDLTNNKEAATLEGHHDWVLCVAYHREQSLVASGSFDGEVCIWNAADGKLLAHWKAVP